MRIGQFHFRVEIRFSNGNQKTIFLQRLQDVEQRSARIAKQENSTIEESRVYPQTSYAKRVLKLDYLLIDNDKNYQFFLKGEQVSFF